jgi:hypothetical protein
MFNRIPRHILLIGFVVYLCPLSSMSVADDAVPGFAGETWGGVIALINAIGL